MKHKLIELKGEIHNSTIIVEDFNTSISIIKKKKKTRENVSKEGKRRLIWTPYLISRIIVNSKLTKDLKQK